MAMRVNVSRDDDEVAHFETLPPPPAVTQGDVSRVYPAKRQLCHLDDAMMASPLPALPDDYNELLHTAIHTTCAKCGETPKKPAQCLVCGALVCPKAKCCAEAGKGECTQHAERFVTNIM